MTNSLSPLSPPASPPHHPPNPPLASVLLLIHDPVSFTALFAYDDFGRPVVMCIYVAILMALTALLVLGTNVCFLAFLLRQTCTADDSSLTPVTPRSSRQRTAWAMTGFGSPRSLRSGSAAVKRTGAIARELRADVHMREVI